MTNRKGAVLKISATKTRGKGLNCNSKTLLQSNENYCQSCNPFYTFIYEEVKKLREEKQNEKDN